MGSMSTHVTAADLNRGHLGKSITFSIGEAKFTDRLRSVTHEADLIDMRPMFQEEPSYELGRTQTVLGLMRAGEVTLGGATDVEVTE